jgi:phage tail protein X
MNRYSNIRPLTLFTGDKIYPTVIYPEIPLSESDIYVITGDGDRFDLLADQYYGDSTLWWIISCANPTLPQNSLIPPLGSQIRIPINYSSTIQSFNQLNAR